MFIKTEDRGIVLSDKALSMKNDFEKNMDNGYYKYVNIIQCLCGKSNVRCIANEDRYGFNINTVICKNCGIVRTSPYYDEKTLRTFYSECYSSIYRNNQLCDDNLFETRIIAGNNICNRF